MRRVAIRQGQTMTVCETAGKQHREAPAAGVIHLPAGELAVAGQESWVRFAASWDNLPADTFMADGGSYRQRRYAAFEASRSGIVRLPHRPHFQERAHNALNGGIARWFAPMEPAVADCTPFRHILQVMADRVATHEARPPAAWLVEAHQFRIVAQAGQPGLPTPEGMHRDGRDWVLICLIGSGNIGGGETLVRDGADRIVLRHRLMQPGEGLLLDDRRVRHETSSIEALVPDAPAWRDTLVLTFARAV